MKHCPAIKERGQALIVVLLVSAIGLTIGLSLASRTTDDSNLATEIEESSRAFSAAEAGLEAAAQQLGVFGTLPTGTVGSGGRDAKYNVDIVEAGGTASAYIFPGELHSNQPITVWLNDYRTQSATDKYSGSTIELCWGEDGGELSAFEVTFYYKNNAGTYYLAREVYNPSGSTLVAGATNIPQLGAGVVACGSDSFTHRTTVNLTTMKSNTPYNISGTYIPLMLKLRPIVENSGTTKLGVAPIGDSLPLQGEEHISLGTTDGGQQTKLIQFISFPAPPEIFDTVIYSEEALTK